jgi:hypothetical protein
MLLRSAGQKTDIKFCRRLAGTMTSNNSGRYRSSSDSPLSLLKLFIHGLRAIFDRVELCHTILTAPSFLRSGREADDSRSGAAADAFDEAASLSNSQWAICRRHADRTCDDDTALLPSVYVWACSTYADARYSRRALALFCMCSRTAGCLCSECVAIAPVQPTASIDSYMARSWHHLSAAARL